MKLDAKLEGTSEKAELVASDSKGGKRGGLPLPLVVLVGALAAIAFFILRKGDDSDYDDFGEDAFRYEMESDTTSTTPSEFNSTENYNSGGNGASMDYTTMSSGDVETAH